MTLAPGASRVHERRQLSRYCAQTNDFDIYAKAGEFHRGVFEKKYGYPTDVDAVWADRALPSPECKSAPDYFVGDA